MKRLLIAVTLMFASAASAQTAKDPSASSKLIGRGVDGSKVSDFAKTAPSGRSLAVPLYATGSLMDRGLKSDAALARVHTRLMQKATDRQLTTEANATASEKRPATANKEGGQAHRPATAGAGSRPGVMPARPVTPGRKR
jgi:hypothetical protein